VSHWTPFPVRELGAADRNQVRQARRPKVVSQLWIQPAHVTYDEAGKQSLLSLGQRRRGRPQPSAKVTRHALYG
jgi:hypothetical protein